MKRSVCQSSRYKRQNVTTHTQAGNHTQLKMHTHTHANNTGQSSKASDDEDNKYLTSSECQSAVLRHDTQTDAGQSL